MRSGRLLHAGIAALVLASCSGGGAPPAPTSGVVAQSEARPVAVVHQMTIPPESPPPATKAFGSTWGKIAPYQVFDSFPTTGTAMTDQEIEDDAYRYPVVWGSFNPQPWTQGNPNVFVSHYYVPEEDSNMISGHNLAWWQANHPSWILYACTSSGQPTTELAYVPGIGYPDVPLDFHNPDVIHYQIYESLIPYMQANGYNAVALDQVALYNLTVGGNPELGQQVVTGDYGCGIYQKNGTFVARYTSGGTNAVYAADMLNWIATLRKAFHDDPAIAKYHYKILVNHTVQSENANELALLGDVDLEMIEPGYSDYGNYVNLDSSSFFLATLNWVKWVQSHNVAIGVIDKFDNVDSVTPDQIEFSIATYLLGNEGAEYLYTAPDNGPGYGYGAEQWHSEYAAQIGKPCAESYGGPSYNASTPNLYYRNFNGGMVVANFGGATQNATLPANRTYTDLENRTVTNPLPVAQNDAWVLLQKYVGNGCQ